MKKLQIAILLLSAFTLGSCASKGWSCSKRYCNTSETSVIKDKVNQDTKANV